MKTDLVQGLLQEVRATGSVRIDKRQLLWMLGRQKDHASVWPLLLNEWEELGGARGELHGMEWYGYISLMGSKVDNVQKVWAKE
ncbi:hypothetical protein OKC48_04140 [Methylorubrum extorquens]|uniref:hypothetical protein n=1 Tax=Methylorubrum extorquens TaxID=408 RepID=UPI002237B10A|nr:hypothetical protein [Methylorubrum extorquens]UYW27710.1 hypothetical protein OKC48_04140 [Methylorubrum extorquens]